MTPADTSAEAVLVRVGLQWNGPREFVCTPMADGYWTPWHVADSALAAARLRIADLESLLAARNVQNAAAFTASDGYQSRCEQGDALLREARPYLDSFAQLTKHPTAGDDALAYKARIEAHLAGEDMGRKL